MSLTAGMCPDHCQRQSSSLFRISAGFTLLELLVVLVLLSLVTGLAVPSLRTSLFSDQLKAAARLLTGLILETSQLAVQEQATWYLDLDQEKNRIRSRSALPREDTRQPERVINLPDSVRIFGVSSVHGKTAAKGEMQVVFSPRGYVDRTHIFLRDEDGREMTLMLSPFLGTIQVVDSHVSLE